LVRPDRGSTVPVACRLGDDLRRPELRARLSLLAHPRQPRSQGRDHAASVILLAGGNYRDCSGYQ
jgi:hypothetical protein